jgi:hypothetical protein
MIDINKFALGVYAIFHGVWMLVFIFLCSVLLEKRIITYCRPGEVSSKLMFISPGNMCRGAPTGKTRMFVYCDCQTWQHLSVSNMTVDHLFSWLDLATCVCMWIGQWTTCPTPVDPEIYNFSWRLLFYRRPGNTRTVVYFDSQTWQQVSVSKYDRWPPV